MLPSILEMAGSSMPAQQQQGSRCLIIITVLRLQWGHLWNNIQNKKSFDPSGGIGRSKLFCYLRLSQCLSVNGKCNRCSNNFRDPESIPDTGRTKKPGQNEGSRHDDNDIPGKRDHEGLWAFSQAFQSTGGGN